MHNNSQKDKLHLIIEDIQFSEHNNVSKPSASIKYLRNIVVIDC